jgi:hypothetical protein
MFAARTGQPERQQAACSVASQQGRCADSQVQATRTHQRSLIRKAKRKQALTPSAHQERAAAPRPCRAPGLPACPRLQQTQAPQPHEAAQSWPLQLPSPAPRPPAVKPAGGGETPHVHVPYMCLCVCVGATGVRARSAALQAPQLAGAAQTTALHSSPMWTAAELLALGAHRHLNGVLLLPLAEAPPRKVASDNQEGCNKSDCTHTHTYARTGTGTPRVTWRACRVWQQLLLIRLLSGTAAVASVQSGSSEGEDNRHST